MGCVLHMYLKRMNFLVHVIAIMALIVIHFVLRVVVSTDGPR